MRHAFLLRHLALTGTLLAAAGVMAPVRAQDPDDIKRGVARISLINGDVNVRRGDSGEWVAGVINAPVLTDDRIATGPASRTEIQFDAYNVMRVGSNADLHLTQVEYARYQMELGRGTATFRTLRESGVDIEIDTPSVSVRPSRQGSVRIAVNDEGETEVTARNGDVEVFTPHGSQWIRNGQTMLARGSASDPEFQIVNAGGMDDWDRWSDSRDRMILQSNSNRYVGPGVYGAEELDAYGTWQSDPEYGNVWRPTVAPDWAPYHYGRWTWVDWYGWTWVSSDPWGWAPYHYGRWFHNDRFGWCWYPGAMTARHYWSPALVAFVGFGGGGGVGFGFGNVGWVPLAPYEVYHPWWGRSWYRSGGYMNRQVNITNINITNVYRNSRFNGVSAVGYHDFQNGRFGNVGRYNGNQIREAGAIRGQMPFAPGSQNLRFSDRNPGHISRGNESGRFFRHQTPNPVDRVPFRQQIGQGGGSNAPAYRPAGDSQGNGWRRFGSPSNGEGRERGGSGGNSGSRQVPPAPSQPDNRGGGGWQRFGSPSNGDGRDRGGRQGQPQQENRGGGWQRSGSSAPQSGGPSNGEGRDRGGYGGNSGSRQGQPQQPAPSQQENHGGGWQRFGRPGSGGTPEQPSQRWNDGQGRRFGGGQERQSQPQGQPPAPRQDYQRQYGGSGGNSRPEHLRISPPVVRERPSYNGGSRQQAPSAPSRSNGGGGGGASHGNGGGNRGGGGGGHRGR